MTRLALNPPAGPEVVLLPMPNGSRRSKTAIRAERAATMDQAAIRLAASNQLAASANLAVS
jgi:hypothetical protein